MSFMGMAVHKDAPWIAGDDVTFRAKWNSFFHHKLQDLELQVQRTVFGLGLLSKKRVMKYQYIGPDSEGWYDIRVTLVRPLLLLVDGFTLSIIWAMLTRAYSPKH
jgi:hypothetical protein